MLIVHPEQVEELVDTGVRDLVAELRAGDVVVINDTRVIPARLHARRERPGASGAKIELLLHQQIDDEAWSGFARPAKRLKPGDRLVFGSATGDPDCNGLTASVVEIKSGGEVSVKFDVSGARLSQAIATLGEMPLPPYIASARPADSRDREDYQTIYARTEGAVAAPTAGLHLTQQMFEALENKGIDICRVTLHVGAGTFLPVKAEDTEHHAMHAEWGEVSRETAERLNLCRKQAGRIVAVGTTTLRLLETAVAKTGEIEPFRGSTDIFITPGFAIRGCDLLLTNFHLPKSTLFMLVSAFCGLDVMQRAYAHAVAGGYRFYSYGDACLLYPKGRG